MRHNDAQIGRPETIFKDTKANIEAIVSPVEGMIAHATDTHLLGFFTGSAWAWYSSGGGSSGTGGQIIRNTNGGLTINTGYSYIVSNDFEILANEILAVEAYGIMEVI